MERILDCPFCACMSPASDSPVPGTASLNDDGTLAAKYYVECVKCDARSSKLSDPHEVILRWNRAAQAALGLKAAHARAERAWNDTLDDCRDLRQAGLNAIEAIQHG